MMPKLMLDRWLENARGRRPTNAYFFRILLSAGRGMISAETMAELEARWLLYILGVRERTDKRVRELVLDDAAPFAPLVKTKRGN
jgi:hypothetical protein